MLMDLGMDAYPSVQRPPSLVVSTINLPKVEKRTNFRTSTSSRYVDRSL